MIIYVDIDDTFFILKIFNIITIFYFLCSFPFGFLIRFSFICFFFSQQNSIAFYSSKNKPQNKKYIQI